MNQVEIIFGNENFGNYERLSYKWWYAFAEFIDNASQSYFDNRDALDKAFESEQERFRVAITTGQNFCRITDNAMGMNFEDIQRAMVVGVPREGATGRCKYGLGMKTAACWIGRRWKIITTKLGSNKKYTLEINVSDVVGGNPFLSVTPEAAEEGEHYTILEIRDHHRPLKGSRTISKIRTYLPSIYRQDLSEGRMILTYNDELLEGKRYSDSDFMTAKGDGGIYKKSLIFSLDENDPSSKVVEGWVGILDGGKRSEAGFSILQHARVIMGWPDNWRPAEIFGEGGRNDLVNQRLVGEINLADFEVSHTKDEINWHGEEEELVGARLKSECQDFIDIARKPRKGSPPGHGPRPVDVDVACKTMEDELAAPELLSRLSLEPTLPPVKQIAENNSQVIQNAESHAPAFTVNVGDIEVRVFLDSNGSPYDPYFLHESRGENSLAIFISTQHPHWSMLEGDNAVLNYLRHCVYDGLAEFRATKIDRQLEADSVKMLKDGYLRIAFEVLQSDDD